VVLYLKKIGYLTIKYVTYKLNSAEVSVLQKLPWNVVSGSNREANNKKKERLGPFGISYPV
jgi:hypothetical protein